MAVVKTRKLSELFQAGAPLVLGDGAGEPVTVYLQKLNPVDNETAVRRANSVRAQYVRQKDDPNSEGYLSALNELVDMSDEELAVYAATDELARRTEMIEAEWAEENGWLKDDYLQGIWDRWNEPGIQEGYFVDEGEEKDPESVRIFDEMQRYADELTAQLEKHQKHLEDEYRLKTREQLLDMLIERLVKMSGDLAWMVEYRKCEVWLGVRKSEKDRTRYFTHRHEVDELEQETLKLLIEGMANLQVEVDQGKDSRVTGPSSNLSDSPEPQEAESSSSPQE